MLLAVLLLPWVVSLPLVWRRRIGAGNAATSRDQCKAVCGLSDLSNSRSRYINMASVTSLDRDLRSLRLSRYTPQAAAKVRDWIEEALQEPLPSEDLLDALKDGVALCK